MGKVIKGIKEKEIERIMDEEYEKGEREEGYVIMRMKMEVEKILKEWIMRK